jgi:hypothetical protein
MTRPNVAHAHSVLARFLTNLGPIHLSEIKHVWQYLYGTRYLAISARGVSLLRPMRPKSTQQLLPSLVLLMHYLETMLRLVNHLLDMSLCSMACLLIRKLLCFSQSLVLPLKQSCTLSQLPALNRNTGTASAATSTSRFIPRRVSGMTMHRLYALLKVTLIAFKRSFAMSISIKCGSARRYILKESMLNGSLLLRCLLTASQNCFLNRNTRTSYASLA